MRKLLGRLLSWLNHEDVSAVDEYEQLLVELRRRRWADIRARR